MRWPYANQEDGSHQNHNMLECWSQASSLQDCENINFCCLRYPVSGILLWHSELMGTVTSFLHVYILNIKFRNWAWNSGVELLSREDYAKYCHFLCSCPVFLNKWVIGVSWRRWTETVYALPMAGVGWFPFRVDLRQLRGTMPRTPRDSTGRRCLFLIAHGQIQVLVCLSPAQQTLASKLKQRTYIEK